MSAHYLRQFISYLRRRTAAERIYVVGRVFGRERLGQLLNAEMRQHVRDLLLDTDELALIDVTDAESAGARRGHSYFRESPWVSSDILATLKYGLTPAERGLIRQDPNLPIWSFPPDFVDRLRAQLALEETEQPAAR